MVLLYGLRGVRVGEASNPGRSRQLSPGHGALSESPPPTRRSARLQAMVQRAGHRRGLVVEVAPGVVDATVVALPNLRDHPCRGVQCASVRPVEFRRGGRAGGQLLVMQIFKGELGRTVITSRWSVLDEPLVTTAERVGTTVPEAFDLTIVDSESDVSMSSFVQVNKGGRRVFEEEVVQQILPPENTFFFTRRTHSG